MGGGEEGMKAGRNRIEYAPRRGREVKESNEKHSRGQEGGALGGGGVRNGREVETGVVAIHAPNPKSVMCRISAE